MSDLQTMRREYDEVVVGNELRQLLWGIVWSTARQYPARYYAHAFTQEGVWTPEVLEDALSEWIATRLLRRGDLAEMLSRANTIAHLRAMLTTSFRQFLRNQRLRLTALNLCDRATDLLQSDDAFLAIGKSDRASQLWTVQEHARRTTSRVPDSELVAIAFELDDASLEVVRYQSEEHKLSPILRAPALKRFLLHLLTRARTPLPQADIDAVIRRRFDLPDIATVSLDVPGGSILLGAVATEGIDPEEAALSTLRRLGPDSALLATLLDASSLEAAADSGGVEPRVLMDVVQRARDVIEEFFEDEDRIYVTLEHVVHLAATLHDEPR